MLRLGGEATLSMLSNGCQRGVKVASLKRSALYLLQAIFWGYQVHIIMSSIIGKLLHTDWCSPQKLDSLLSTSKGAKATGQFSSGV